MQYYLHAADGHMSPVAIPHFVPEPVEKFYAASLNLGGLNLNCGYGGESGYEHRVMVHTKSFPNTNFEFKDFFWRKYLVHFDSQGEFQTELQKAKTEGRLPITLEVDLYNLMLHQKGGKINHVINVTKVFDDGTAEIFDPQSDYHQKRKFRLPISKLYESTIAKGKK